MGRVGVSTRAPPPTRLRARPREMDPIIISPPGKGWEDPAALAKLSIEFTSGGVRNLPFLNKLPPLWLEATLLSRSPNSGGSDALGRVFGEAGRLIAGSKKDEPHTIGGSGAGMWPCAMWRNLITSSIYGHRVNWRPSENRTTRRDEIDVAAIKHLRRTH